MQRGALVRRKLHQRYAEYLPAWYIRCHSWSYLFRLQWPVQPGALVRLRLHQRHAEYLPAWKVRRNQWPDLLQLQWPVQRGSLVRCRLHQPHTEPVFCRHVLAAAWRSLLPDLQRRVLLQCHWHVQARALRRPRPLLPAGRPL